MPALPQTPSQTVGPFFHYGLVFGGENSLVDQATRGERITLTGRVLDGDGAPLPDALVELWSADAAGHFPHPADPGHAQADPHFRHFGRSDTTHAGHTYRFETIKPGAVAAAGSGRQAPHVALRIFARGLLLHLNTRLYFADETAANAADPFLNSLPPARRATLIAAHAGPAHYALDLVLQGPGETIFLT